MPELWPADVVLLTGASGYVGGRLLHHRAEPELGGLADEVVQSADRGRAPHVEIPSRSLTNVRFNRTKRIIEMGSGTNRRELFNLRFQLATGQLDEARAQAFVAAYDAERKLTAQLVRQRIDAEREVAGTQPRSCGER